MPSAATGRHRPQPERGLERVPGEERRQRGRPHEPAVDGRRAGAPLGDGPDDQALAPGLVPAHEDPVGAGRPVRVGRHRAPWPDLDAELVDRVAALRSRRSPWPAAPARTRARTPSPAPPRRPGARPRSASRPCARASARTAPEPSSTNSVVVTENSRAPPSSCAEEVRRMSGHSGHGLSASRSLGGSAMISSWWTEAAPWRCAVPEAVGPRVAAADDDDPLALGVDGRPVRARPPGPGWTASGTRGPGGRRRAPGPAPAGPGAAWRRRPARPRRMPPAPRRPGAR